MFSDFVAQTLRELVASTSSQGTVLLFYEKAEPHEEDNGSHEK